MIQEEFRVGNKLGLHARAAARFVKTASRFKSQVTLSKPNSSRSADGKSILEILMLAAQPGAKLLLIVSGEDEQDAYKALRQLINNKFDEE